MIIARDSAAPLETWINVAGGEHVRVLCSSFQPFRLPLGVSSSQGLPDHNSANFEQKTTRTEATLGQKLLKQVAYP